MTPEEESVLLKRVDVLTTELEKLREELDLYRINGLSDAFSGKGNQTFGSGTVRLDKYGVQIASRTSDEQRSAINFGDYFSDNPTDETVKSYISGSVIANAARMWLVSKSQADSSSELRFYSEDNDSTLILSANGGGTNVPMLELEGTSGGDGGNIWVSGSPFGFANMFSDFLSPITGSVWFRNDTDEFKAYLTSSYATIATQEWANSSFVPRGTGTSKTIATGAITINSTYHKVDTESSSATDDLDTINGGITGQILILCSVNNARDVTLKDGTGNLRLAGDFILTNTQDAITLIYDGTNWLELSRSDNA